LVDSRTAGAQTGSHGYYPAQPKEKAMAKGQMRSNKEVKKPKKDKSKPATTDSGATMGQRFAAAADKNKDAKK
jgi:hypothetical protein